MSLDLRANTLFLILAVSIYTTFMHFLTLSTRVPEWHGQTKRLTQSSALAYVMISGGPRWTHFAGKIRRSMVDACKE